MRLFRAFILVILVGCSTGSDTLFFDIRSKDVASASAEPLKNRLTSGVDTDTPQFQAQIHIVFNEDGARRFKEFSETHAGQLFELRVNGKVLLSGVYASPAGGREFWWYSTSLDQAQDFAASLTRK